MGNLSIKIKRGQVIPVINLKNIKGEEFRSENLLRKDKLIIFFFCSLEEDCCKDYLKLLNSIYDKIEGQGCTILGISSESPQDLNKFCEENDIRFDILLDPDNRVLDRFIFSDSGYKNICALFITDKFQSLYKAYHLLSPDAGILPGKERILNSLDFLDKQCPECGENEWPPE